MPTTSRTIRLFVSSTFSDFKAERDLLQRKVFPELQQYCLSKGLRFQAIDLRWGVSEEAGKHNQTMRICLLELQRCQVGAIKPNFLVLLGDRYGWKPLPPSIPADLFELMRPLIREQDPKAAAALQWYRRDDNAVPPAYMLQPRTGELADDSNRWAREVENPLLTALEEAATQCVRQGNFSEEQQAVLNTLHIGLSATHQEIIHGALTVPEAHQHVHAFFRKIRNFPESPPLKAFIDVAADGAPNATAADRLAVLKADVERHIGSGNMHGYTVDWQDDGDFDDGALEAFRQEVLGALTAVIEQQVAALEAVPADVREETAHGDFGAERREGFVGRNDLLNRVADHIHVGSGSPLAVVGPAGSGKSAFMAEAPARARAAHPHAIVVERYIGATPGSSDLVTLLRDVVAVIRHTYPTDTPSEAVAGDTPSAEIPFEINPLVSAFHEALGRPTADHPLILFLDALDQLNRFHLAHELYWLPTSLSQHTRLIVSAASPDVTRQSDVSVPSEHETSSVWTALVSRFSKQSRLELFPLTLRDGENMLDHLLGRAGRTLQPWQRRSILQGFAVAGNPLWLRVAANEAALFPDWELVPDFPQDTPDLIRHSLQRLSSEEHHGQVLVERALSYLACSRHGLAEDEMFEILSADPKVMADVIRRSPTEQRKIEREQIKSLPAAIWVAFRGDIANYLTEYEAHQVMLMRFYHRSFREAVEKQFLLKQTVGKARHRHLAKYFVGCANGNDPQKEWETENTRGFAECIFHLAKAGQHGEAAGLLTCFPFLLHKLRVGLLEGAFEDYDMMRSVAPADTAKLLEVWSDFFREKGHILRRGEREWPAHKILLQLAVEHADDSPVTAAAEKWLEGGRCDWMWWRASPRPRTLRQRSSHPSLVLEGHTRSVRGALVLSSGAVVSWQDAAHDDNALRVWHGESGACLGLLKGHSSQVSGAIELPDGTLVSWAWDKTLRVWQTSTCECLCVLQSHEGSVLGAGALSRGTILSWGSDGVLRMWDSVSGRCLHAIQAHTAGTMGALVGALVLPEQRILSWSESDIDYGEGDRALHVWDSHSGERLFSLLGHTEPVFGVIAIGGRRLLSWAADQTLRVWCSDTGECLSVLEGDIEEIGGAAELPNGRILSWSHSGAIRIWDGTSGRCLVSVEASGHHISEFSVCALANGNFLTSKWPSWAKDSVCLWSRESAKPLSFLEHRTHDVRGAITLSENRVLCWGDNGMLSVWDGDNANCLATLDGHSGNVNGAMGLGDGRILSWSDDTTLRLWAAIYTRPSSEQPRKLFSGLECIAPLPSNGLLSWGVDSALRVLDPRNAAVLASLQGHTKRVVGATVLGDGRALSWSNDGTIRLWSVARRRCLAVFQGHTSDILGATELPDGSILSWGRRDIIRWDPKRAACRTSVQTRVDHAMQLEDGRLLSWDSNYVFQMWDPYSGARLLRLDLSKIEARRAHIIDVRETSSAHVHIRLSDDTVFILDCTKGECVSTCDSHASGSINTTNWIQKSRINHEEFVFGIYGDYYVSSESGYYVHIRSQARSIELRHRRANVPPVRWESDQQFAARCLLEDGTLAAGYRRGRVSCVQLYHGGARIALADVQMVRGASADAGTEEAETRERGVTLSDYEDVLRGGLRSANGSGTMDHLGHLRALACYLDEQGKHDEAQRVRRDERDAVRTVEKQARTNATSMPQEVLERALKAFSRGDYLTAQPMLSALQAAGVEPVRVGICLACIALLERDIGAAREHGRAAWLSRSTDSRSLPRNLWLQLLVETVAPGNGCSRKWRARVLILAKALLLMPLLFWLIPVWVLSLRLRGPARYAASIRRALQLPRQVLKISDIPMRVWQSRTTWLPWRGSHGATHRSQEDRLPPFIALWGWLAAALTGEFSEDSMHRKRLLGMLKGVIDAGDRHDDYDMLPLLLRLESQNSDMSLSLLFAVDAVLSRGHDASSLDSLVDWRDTTVHPCEQG